MSAGPISEPFFEILNSAWQVANLQSVITGGMTIGGAKFSWFNFQPPEQSSAVEGASDLQRPYIVVRTVGEAPNIFSNFGQYDRLQFEAAVYGTEEYEKTARQLIQAVESATLPILPGTAMANGATLKMIRPGTVRYEYVRPFYVVTEEFTVQFGKPRGN